MGGGELIVSLTFHGVVACLDLTCFQYSILHNCYIGILTVVPINTIFFEKIFSLLDN